MPIIVLWEHRGNHSSHKVCFPSYELGRPSWVELLPIHLVTPASHIISTEYATYLIGSLSFPQLQLMCEKKEDIPTEMNDSKNWSGHTEMFLKNFYASSWL